MGGFSTCQQTKVWFPFIRGNFIPQVRRLNRYDLGHLIHFTTGHNFLLRHGCKLTGGGSNLCRLCGGAAEDALHLWSACSATQSLGVGGILLEVPFLGPPLSFAGSLGFHLLLC